MKKLFTVALLASVAFCASAQTAFINRNVNESIVRKVTTDSSDATRIDLIAIDSNETGHIVIKVVGYAPDSSAAVTGTRTYRYTKVAGTLTLGSAIETVAIVADTKVSGSTFAASALNNNIEIKVTGKDPVVMYWRAIIKQTAVKVDD